MNNNDDELKPDDLGTVAKNFIGAMKSWQSAGRPIVTKACLESTLQLVEVVSGGKKLQKHKLLDVESVVAVVLSYYSVQASVH